MKIAASFFLLLTLAFSLSGCASLKAVKQAKPFPLGDYSYTGYDRNGKKIVEGSISITSLEKDSIRGEWRLEQVGQAEHIGPQVGAGALTGTVAESSVYINLNPNMADNNVNLVGQIDKGRYSGKWSYNGYAGSMNYGTFEATAK